MPVFLIAVLFWGGGIGLMEWKAECVNGLDSKPGMCLIDGVKHSVSGVTRPLEDYIKDHM